MTTQALDPGAQELLQHLADARAKGVPALHEVTPDKARAMNMRSTELFGSQGPALDCQALDLPGPAGDIPARLYRGAEGLVPVVVYYHGGGWVIGSLDSHDGLCRHLASRAGVAVLSVDYRLAPEHVFPAAVEDAYAALEWVAANAYQHQLNPDGIIVAGDSAGGNLAAVVALMSRDNGGPEIAMQALLYPGTDMHMKGASHQLFTEHLLTPETIRWFREQYLTSEQQRDDWRASPLYAERFDALPPAYVMTAGFDPLRDEGKLYADKLEAAGVPLSYKCFDGQIHGFLTMDKVIPQALEAVADLAAAINRSVG